MKKLILSAIVLCLSGAAWGQCPQGQELFVWNGHYKFLDAPLRVDGNWVLVSEIEERTPEIKKPVSETCWEYLVVRIGQSGALISETLNDYSKWELVSHNLGGLYHILIFKRPKPCTPDDPKPISAETCFETDFICNIDAGGEWTDKRGRKMTKEKVLKERKENGWELVSVTYGPPPGGYCLSSYYCYHFKRPKPCEGK